MALGMGIVALVIVALGVVVAIVFAGRQADEEAAPKSEPSDFVAPVSSGGFAWRRTDESPEDFKRRVAQENAATSGTRAAAPDSRKA